MAKRFIKFPFSKNIRAGKDALHYVWLDADSITHIEYRNGDKEPFQQVTRVYYLQGDGKETWYQSSVITPEEVLALFHSDQKDVMQLLDNELSNTLIQTQHLLKDTMLAQQKAESQCESMRRQLISTQTALSAMQDRAKAVEVIPAKKKNWFKRVVQWVLEVW